MPFFSHLFHATFHCFTDVYGVANGSSKVIERNIKQQYCCIADTTHSVDDVFFDRKSTDNAKHRCDYRKRTVSRTLGAVTSRTERTREAKQQQQKMISQPLWTYYMCTMRKSGLRKRFISAFVQLLSSFPSSPTAGCFVYTIYRLFARSPTHTFDILFARAHSLHPCSIRAIQSRLFSSIFI